MNPFRCCGCGTSVLFFPICSLCLSAIRRNTSLLKSPISSLQFVAPLLYSIGTTHELVKSWKSDPGLFLERTLFKFEANLEHELLDLNLDSIVPIPQLQARNWKRGHASAFSVAEHFSRKLNIPIYSSLHLTQEPFAPKLTKQSGLDAIDRLLAPQPFQFVAGKTGKRILLVDDVITTGNTLSRAAEVLTNSIPEVVLYGASLGYRPLRLD